MHDVCENGVQRSLGVVREENFGDDRHKLTPECRKDCAFAVMQPLMMMKPGLRRLLLG